MTSVLTEGQEKVLNKYREDLLSGRTLALHANSHRGRYGYKPPMSRRSWGRLMQVLGKMAASSDRMAQVASGIVGKVNLYGDDAQACAAMYEGAFQVMNNPFDDVIRRAGPEPGRYSENQHEWTLRDRVEVHYWLALATKGMTASAYGVGWCLSAIAEEVNFYPTNEMKTGELAC